MPPSYGAMPSRQLRHADRGTATPTNSAGHHLDGLRFQYRHRGFEFSGPRAERRFDEILIERRGGFPEASGLISRDRRIGDQFVSRPDIFQFGFSLNSAAASLRNAAPVKQTSRASRNCMVESRRRSVGVTTYVSQKPRKSGLVGTTYPLAFPLGG
jgi:hypothetical protein